MTSSNSKNYKELWEKGVQTGLLRLSTERLSDLLLEEFPPEVWGHRRLNTCRGSNNYLRVARKFQNLAIYGDGCKGCPG
jgi:hypothetical protein